MSAAGVKPYIIVTDGACSRNPGPGGWGLIVVTPQDQVFEFGGHEKETTNNRMELMAVYRGMQEIFKIETKIKTAKVIHIISDSKYVLDGISKYVANWARSAWRTSTGSEVKNQDLWEKILKGLTEFHKLKIRFEYEIVKGHSGHEANERCDQIAVAFTHNEPINLYAGSRAEYSVKVEMNLKLKDEPNKPKVEKYEPIYLSLVNGVLSRHTMWNDCQNATIGISGAKFKKVKSTKEEEEILKLWGL